MADRNNADSRRGLSVDPPPRQIPKDTQESNNNPIPLSPQWLLPKAGDNKEFNPQHGSHSVSLKLSVDNENFYNSGKKREAFRPSHEVDSGRWDRWREEERETNSIHRERRREGDKESNAINRRIDRWPEFSTKHSGEARRSPADKWNDSNNREGDQHRESKWNTRWGPEDKKSENWGNKQLDSRRDGDLSHEKTIPYKVGLGKDINTQGKEIESSDHYSHSWKSNYFVGRGRGDSFHDQFMVPNKHASPFSHGRGRTENGISASYAGHGRFNSSTSTISNSVNRTHHLTLSDKSGGQSGNPPTYRYTRMKLLDIYRSTDLGSSNPLACFIEIPSLMQAETLEPLALSAPTPDEVIILKGIDKGDIINSGTSQVSKDGSVGKTMPGVGSSRPKLDSDLASLNERATMEVNRLESSPYIVPQRTQMTGGHIQRSSLDWKDLTPEVVSRESYLSMSHFQKGIGADNKHNTDFSSSIFGDESKWQNFKGIGYHLDSKGDPRSKQEPPEFMEETKGTHIREEFISRDVLTARKLQSHPSPEDLSLYYKDPQGRIQGPFSGSDLIGWFEAGYFGIDLPVRLAGSLPDSPFSSLGDVMPHLQMKARPPPGFPMAKQIDTLEEPHRLNFGGPNNVQTGPSEFDILKNERRGMYDVATEAQSRFLESMSGNVGTSSKEDFTFTRGMQEFGANLSSDISPSMGGESGSGTSYLSAQTRLLERQTPLSNLPPYWSMKGASPLKSKLEKISDPLTPHSKMLEPEEASQHLQPPQHVDLLSLLHAAAEKTPHPHSNPGTSSWSNFNESRNQNNSIHGIGVLHDNLGLQRNQLMSSGTSQIGFGIQQQRSLASNQATLPHLITQPGEISTFIPPENLLSSDISQDPRLLSLLQQQYLLSQLQLQSQVPVSPQLSLLDKIMLLQQQQKQEQQRQLLLQHQQHLLNQVLTGQQARQQFGDPAHGQADATKPAGNNSKELFGLQRVHEPFEIDQQISAANLHSGKSSSLQNVAMHSSPGVNSLASHPISLHSPHEIFEQSTLSRESNTSMPTENDNNSKDSIIQLPFISDTSSLIEVLKKHEDVSTTQLSGQGLGNVETEPKVVLPSQTGDLNALICSEDLNNLHSLGQSSDFGSSLSAQVQNLKISSDELPDQCFVEFSSQKEASNAELRDSKKASEKKSKKQKNSKTQVAAENGKGLSKAVSEQKSKAELKYSTIDASEIKPKLQGDAEDLIVGVENLKSFAEKDSESSKEISNITGNESKVVEVEAESVPGGKTLITQPTLRAWKPAPGMKPKSILEIQQEEQLMIQKKGTPSEIAPVVTPPTSSAPWSGAGVNSESKSNSDTVQMLTNPSGMSTYAKKLNTNNRSHLHDLLAEEVLASTNEANTVQLAVNDKVSTLPLHGSVVAQAVISVDDGDDFVEAKDTRKNRRKNSKAKGSAVKTPSPIGSVDKSVFPSPIDKGKSFRQVQLEKGPLPALPSGPSLGDFVPWKGDQPNSSPTPAWSLDSGKNKKTTSLRDILREQEKKVVSTPQQVSVPAKVQSNRSSQGSGTSWQVSESSPSHLASPSQTSSQVATISRSKVEDDLFWGPLEQVKPEPKRLDFPSLSSAGSLGAKGGSAKGAPVAAPNRGKPSGELSVDHSLPTADSRGGRVDSGMKSSEALDFRNWFQNEWVKLTGTNDTSFLEFCIKQPTSEAEMLLRENLGSLDSNHEFIDKFLNYKEFLSADVIEIAFQTQKSNISSSNIKRHGNSNTTVTRDTDGGSDDRNDETYRGGGKKKGKKGHKVSPSVLGFNVVSNRIMMGEIQSIE